MRTLTPQKALATRSEKTPEQPSLILGWDCSTPLGSTFLLHHTPGQTKVLSELHFETKSADHEKLLLAIDHVLTLNQKTLQDVSYLAVGLGPGSFTGLRIAHALAKSFNLALQLPIYGISSLCLLGAPLEQFLKASPKQHAHTLGIVIANAYEQELYIRWIMPEEPLWQAQEECLLIEEFFQRLCSHKKQILFIGMIPPAVEQHLLQTGAYNYCPTATPTVSATHFAVGWESFHTSLSPVSYATLVTQYFKDFKKKTRALL